MFKIAGYAKVKDWDDMAENADAETDEGIYWGNIAFYNEMSEYCGKIMVIRDINTESDNELDGIPAFYLGEVWDYIFTKEMLCEPTQAEIIDTILPGFLKNWKDLDTRFTKSQSFVTEVFNETKNPLKLLKYKDEAIKMGTPLLKAFNRIQSSLNSVK